MSPINIGLTGSIGMGKSTTARMFADLGVPVWDADAAVHEIYGPGGAGVAALSALIPDAVAGGFVDRTVLKAAIAQDPDLLGKIEHIVHPLVNAHRVAFRERHCDADLLLFDIPLLFETGADDWLDKIIVVSAPPEVQRRRVLDRPGMTEAQFETILSRQMPDDEKRARAHYVIETDKGLDHARGQVMSIWQEITEQAPDA